MNISRHFDFDRPCHVKCHRPKKLRGLISPEFIRIEYYISAKNEMKETYSTLARTKPQHFLVHVIIPLFISPKIYTNI